MPNPKCYFVGPFPAQLSEQALKNYIHTIYFHASSKYPEAIAIVILCSEETIPLPSNKDYLTCKFQSKIIYNFHQIQQYFSDCVSCTEYFPTSKELGHTLIPPFSSLFPYLQAK